MDTDIVITVVMIIMMLLTMLTLMFVYVNTVYRARKENDERKYLHVYDEFRASKEKLEYSEALLSYVKTFTAQVVTLKFKEFLDNHHLEKLTRETIKKEVASLASFIRISINDTNIDFDRSLYTREYIYEYIIQVTVTMTKKMLDDALVDVEE